MNNKKRIISNSIFILITVIIVVIVALRKYIFPSESLLANLYEEDFSSRFLVRLIKTIIIVIVCIMCNTISRLIDCLEKKIKNNQAKTIVILCENGLKYISVIIGVLMIIGTWGVDTATLITGAGVLTLIIGLGCQSLVADVVAGIFILFEGDFKIGDVVVISGWRGTVQSIGLRTTKIIDAVGNVKIINNSTITEIVNNTKDLSVALCDVGIEYNESLERVENIINQNLEKMKEKIPAIVNGPYYKGVAELGESCVLIRLIAQCKEEDKYQTERDLNREIKLMFDKNNINIPFNQVVLNYREDEETEVVTKKMMKKANEFVIDQKEKSKGIDKDDNN